MLGFVVHDHGTECSAERSSAGVQIAPLRDGGLELHAVVRRSEADGYNTSGKCDDDDHGQQLDECEAPDEDEDDETEDEGSGDEESCGADENGANPTDGNGADLSNGDKWEHCGDDVSVHDDGMDFDLNQQLTSNPDYTAPCVGGASTTFSAFNNLEIVGTDAIMKFGARGAITVDISPEGSSWTVPGPTSQEFHKTDVDSTYAVYQLQEPGRWTTEYWRANEPGESGGGWVETVDEHVGLIRRRFDNHGNKHFYDYKKVGFDPEDDVRLAAIYLNGEPGDNDPPDAKVRFRYIMGSGDNGGKVESVAVYRFVGVSETQVLTQLVLYRYMDDDDTTLFSGLGTDGDLVQTVKLQRIDPAPGAAAGVDQWKVSVTQNRYHNLWASNESMDDDNDGFIEKGNPHQIKMIFDAEQIEFGHQQYMEDNPDDPISIIKFAQDLLTLADGAAIYTGASLDVVDLASTVVEEYEEWVETSPAADEYGRVLAQYIQSACGCGGSTQGTKFGYTYTDRNSTPASAETIVVVESRLNGVSYDNYRTHYYEMEYPESGGRPYLGTKAIKDTESGGTGREWVWHYDYDSTDRNLIRQFTPSAIDSYTVGGGGVPTFNTSDGLIYEYEYTTDNRVKENYVRKGTTGTRTMTVRTTYGDADGGGTAWDADNSRDHYVSQTERFRTVAAGQNPGGAGANDIEVAKYFYGFHTDDTSADDIAWIQTDVEAEIEAENGPDGSYTSYEMFDTLGNNFWSRAADTSLTKRTFDAATGQLLTVQRNADTVLDSIPSSFGTGGVALSTSGWGDRYGDGGSLLTEYMYDLLGRVNETITPGLVSTYTLREMRETEERPGITYYAVVKLPHEITGGSSYNGPATINWYNAGGDVIASRSYEIDTAYTSPPGNDDYEPVFANYGLKDGADEELSRMAVVHDVSGLVTSRAVWPDVSETAQGGKYVTKYFYDTLGRIDYTINPVRTLTRSTYDVFDRTIKVEIGLPVGPADDDPDETTIEDISEMFFDHTLDMGSPVQGEGDGNLTFVRQYVDDAGSSTWRDTENTYDFRNRQIKIENPEWPHEFIALDNLDRVIHRGVFEDVPPDTHDFEASDTERRRLETTHYSQRGLVYRTQLAIDPEAAYVASTHAALETHAWFDELGRTVGSWPPSGPGTKTSVDGHGRPAIVYTTDRGGDVDPGGTDNYDDVYDSTDHLATVDGDVVFQQTEYRYIDDTASAHTGVVDLMTKRMRTHDAVDTDTGDLADFTSPNDDLVITTYAGTFYDDADRVIQSVNFGTNIDDEFKFGGTAPTINQSTPPDWDTTGSEIVVETAYNARGLVDTTTEFSEAGTPDVAEITMFVYDDLNRRIAVIENQKDVVESDIAWDNPNQTPDRWVAADVGGTGGELDEDRVTSYVYDGIGNVIIQTAHQPKLSANGDQDQVTRYIFGVTTGINPENSELNSEDLLVQIIYPDTEGGEDDDDRSMFFAYNRQIEPIFKKDQAETEHTYTRDKLGRVTKDHATALGANIDGAVRAITTTYNKWGLVEFVESEDSGGDEVNGVAFRYNDLWQLTDLYQDMTDVAEFNTSGVPLNDTKRVQYLYDTNKMADGNFSRVDRVTYPDGEAISHGYGAVDSSDEDISRLKTINDYAPFPTTNKHVRYDYIGLSMFAQADFEKIDVQLDFTASHGGKRQTQGNSDNDGIYPGYDQFGRTVSQMWVDGNFTEHATPSTDYGNIPPIVELTYTYDKQSNRLTAYDNRPGTSQKLSHEYGYDGFDRLVLAERGDWDGSTFTQQEDSQQWALDMLGNWDSIDTDLDGNNVYTDDDEQEDRDHDDITDANELDTRTLVGQGIGGSDIDLDLTYDKAGNLRTDTRTTVVSTVTWTYTHDAWNRLVLVKAGANDRAIYKYNGLNWLIIKQSDTDSDGTLDQQRMRYYSSGWQMCEERIDDDATFPTDPDDADIDRHVQYVAGIRYVDDCILHREDNDVNGTYDDMWYHLTDVQFSTVAIVDDSAADLIERITYDAYGEARHHYMADWDGSGGVTQTEINQIDTVAGGANHAIGQANYNPDMDIDRNGDVQTADYTIANTEGTHAALAKGLITQSSVDSQIGYDSYVFNAETRQYLARNRWYDPAHGRWIERDPMGYVDGMNLYEYVGGQPTMAYDPFGREKHHWIPKTLWKGVTFVNRGVWTVFNTTVKAPWHFGYKQGHPSYSRGAAKILRSFMTRLGITDVSLLNKPQAQELLRLMMETKDTGMSKFLTRVGVRAEGRVIVNAGHLVTRAAGSFLYAANAGLVVYVGNRAAGAAIETISKYGACCACKADEDGARKSKYVAYGTRTSFWTTEYSGIGTVDCAKVFNAQGGGKDGIYVGFKKPHFLGGGHDDHKWRYCGDI